MFVDIDVVTVSRSMTINGIILVLPLYKLKILGGVSMTLIQILFTYA